MILGRIIGCDPRAPYKHMINNGYFSTLSYDLKASKKCTVRARLRAGGERPYGELATPRPSTDCGVFGIGREAPFRGTSGRSGTLHRGTKAAPDGVDQARRGRRLEKNSGSGI